MVSSSINRQRIMSYLAEEHYDFTCYPALDNLLRASCWSSIDKVLAGFFNLLIFTVFASLRLIWKGVESIIMIGKVLRFFGGVYYQSPDDTAPMSASSFPHESKFFTDYRPNWAVLQPIIRNSGSRHAETPFDLDVAEFLLYMSSLSYESDNVISQVVFSWNHPSLNLKYSRFGHEGLIILILYSVEGQFVVPSFKGTSPFDLYEWLNDFTARKTAPKNNLLPGLVHSGFYDMFGFPEQILLEGPSRWNRYAAMANHPQAPSYAQYTIPDLGHTTGKMPPVLNTANEPDIKILVESFRRLRQHIATTETPGINIGPAWIIDFWSVIENEFQKIATEFGGTKPSLLMTGHSLGAGAASIMAALMMWQRAGHLSEAMKIHWETLFRLEGMITFGTPRPGDYSLCHTIDAIRRSRRLTPDDQPLFYAYRVINGLDIVCSAPLQPSIDLRFDPPTVNNIKLEHPSYLSILDFQHFGDPVVIHHRHKNGCFLPNFRTSKERSFNDIWPNLLGYWVAAFQSFPSNLVETASSLLKLAIVPSLIIDHTLAEYLANMGRMRT